MIGKTEGRKSLKINCFRYSFFETFGSMSVAGLKINCFRYNFFETFGSVSLAGLKNSAS